MRPAGFRAAVRRFLGLTDRPAGNRAVTKEKSSLDSVHLAATGAAVRTRLPPSFSHLRLSSFPASFSGTTSSAGRRSQIYGRPLPDLLAQPRPPHPRRFRPIGIYGGGYGYGPGFGFGFGFPFFFDLSYFDCCSLFAPGPVNSDATPALFLYLNDGSAVEVTDYWVEADMLDYVTEDGKQGTVPIASLDVQRTTEANARVGLKFTLDRTQRGTPLDRIVPPPAPEQPGQQVPPQG